MAATVWLVVTVVKVVKVKMDLRDVMDEPV
jgi:hypothetical protein